MHIEAEIKKWGNSLALRITGAMAEIPHLKAGTKVDIEVKKEALIIKPVRVKNKRKLTLPFEEKQLLLQLTPALAHADELATPTALEIGE